MTESDIAEFLRGGNSVVMFDTNVVFAHNPKTDPFARLCSDVQAWKSEATSHVPQFCLALSSVVLLEKVQDLRQDFGHGFKPSFVHSFLTNNEIKVFDFDRSAAEATGSLIGMTHPTEADWHAFKRRRCLQCLRLPENHDAQGTGQRCGATIDWLVAGHAHHLGALLVTHDKGLEFASVQRKTTLPTLRAAMAVLRAETRPP